MNIIGPRVLQLLPDKTYIKLGYLKHFKRFPNLKNPTTFTEKLQWNKLYNRNPLFTKLVDKIEVKTWVADKIGPEYIIPTLKVWDNAYEIDINELPDKFILKCNHDSHSKQLCVDKKTFNEKEAKKSLQWCLDRNGYWYGREWPYKNVIPKVFAEELLESPDGDLKDYKVMCFNGKAKLIMLNANRFNGELEEAMYDLDWNKTSITQGYPSDKNYQKPEQLDEMIRLSEILAEGINHVRVDWYNVDGKVYFGEMTFFDGSGFVPFDDPKHDILLGSWVDINYGV